ncbi:hypothetical protein EVAR_95708_1 [Eumeta japonica]|uniref:Uncharacterized protein n=1 Tax=Eumeta variegata TaxID=151549 RepID=A0A4C1VIN5_EUMVA|nr:hypothetical protein EVAR_95708_1 [Eumeta japonica]
MSRWEARTEEGAKREGVNLTLPLKSISPIPLCVVKRHFNETPAQRKLVQNIATEREVNNNSVSGHSNEPVLSDDARPPDPPAPSPLQSVK